MKFLDDQHEMLQDAIIEDVKTHLFESWKNSHTDEGDDYLEYQIMAYADDSTKKRYNEYYGLTPQDEFFQMTTDLL